MTLTFDLVNSKFHESVHLSWETSVPNLSFL